LGDVDNPQGACAVADKQPLGGRIVADVVGIVQATNGGEQLERVAVIHLAGALIAVGHIDAVRLRQVGNPSGLMQTSNTVNALAALQIEDF
jgi:hypothetical protein